MKRLVLALLVSVAACGQGISDHPASDMTFVTLDLAHGDAKKPPHDFDTAADFPTVDLLSPAPDFVPPTCPSGEKICVSGGPCVTCCSNYDCTSNACNADGTCAPGDCNNGKQDNSETGIDCGGTCFFDCPNDTGCAVPDDCISGICGDDHLCHPPTGLVPLGSYAIAAQPATIALADIDHDGDLDIVTGNQPTHLLAVWANDGNGAFTETTNVPLTGINRPIHVTDLDGDDLPDLIVVLQNGLSFQPGNGDGTFGTAVVSDFDQTYTFTSELGDFDGDAKLDAILSGFRNIDGKHEWGLFFARGNGDGSFATPVTLVSYDTVVYWNVHVGDLDGDGDTDLVATPSVVANIKEATLFLNHGDGTFASSTLSDGTIGPHDATFGDFDGDLHIDVVLVGEKGMALLRGHGDGTFEAPSVSNAFTSLSNPVADDVDANGTLDLVVTNSDGILTINGDGKGAFATPTLTARANQFGLAHGDLDGDKRNDYVTYGYAANSTASSIHVFFNDAGVLAAPVRYGIAMPSTVLAIDANYDLKSDLIVAYDTGDLVVWRGSGDGTLARDLHLTTPVRSLATADFNNDKKVDLLVMPGPRVLLGKGDGSFAAPIGTQEVYCDDVWAIDLTLDNKLDILCRMLGAPLSLFVGNGDGTFGAAVTVPDPVPTDMQVVDLCGDATPDLVVADNFGIAVYVGHHVAGALPTYGARETLVYQNAPAFAVRAVDLDGDGQRDLVYATESGIRVAKGTYNAFGPPTFGAPASYSSEGGVIALDVLDLDYDGHVDIVSTGYVSGATDTGVLSILRGKGDATFAPRITFGTTQRYWNFLTTVDLDGDKHLDLVLTDRNRELMQVMKNAF